MAEIDEPCRVCGACSPGGRNLFNEIALRPLHRKIHTLFSFSVKPTDVSTIICLECIQLINEFYQYYNRVKSAQITISKDSDAKTCKSSNDPKDSAISQSYCTLSYLEEFEEKTDQNDAQNFESIKKEQLLEICENGINERNELIILSEENFQNITDSCDVKSDIEDFKCFKDCSNDYSDALNFDYNSENTNLINSENFASEEKSDQTSCKQTKVGDKKLNKRVLKRHKLKKWDQGLSENNIAVLTHKKDLDSYVDLPTEIIKDGKLAIKGHLLDDLISQFYNIQCDICHGFPKFKTLTKMMKHYMAKHETKGYLTCCNARFYQHRAIYMHMARHLQPSAFECPICKKAVSRPYSLKLHLQTHLPDDEKPHKCDQCDKRFSYIEGLTSHKMTHVPVEKRDTYNCKICGKVFTLATSFSAHMRSVHSSVRHLCSECGRSFQRKTELTFHMLTHDTTGKNRVQCQHCGFMCKNYVTLKIHLKRHSVERLHCTICDYNTHRRQQLNVHMRVKHSDEKPYVCVMCGKQFKLKSLLMIHMTQHTGEHKFSCAFCPKTFASPGNYHAHRKRMHAEEHRNYIIMKQKERYKEIDSPDLKATEDESEVHELARKYLKKIAEQNVNKKEIK